MLSQGQRNIFSGRQGTQGQTLHPSGPWAEHKWEITSHTKIIGILGWHSQRKASCHTNHSNKQNLIPAAVT